MGRRRAIQLRKIFLGVTSKLKVICIKEIDFSTRKGRFAVEC